MVAKPSIVEARGAIEAALREFTLYRGSDGLHTFENEWGHLEVLLGCDAFKGMSIVQRQDAVWDFLTRKVQPSHLAHISRIHALDRDEYEAAVPRGHLTSGSADQESWKDGHG